MGLFDSKKRAADLSRELGELQRQVGKIEGRVEGLHIEWKTYRDEIKRLVARLEKRDQRAAQREQAALAETVTVPESADPITDRVNARRGGKRGISLSAG